MTDNLAVTSETTEASITPPENEKDEIVELSAHEKAALEKGWKPKDQFQGDPEDYVDAKAFLKGAELRDQIHRLNRKLKDNEKAMDYLIEHNKKVEEIAKKRALEELIAQQQQAVRAGDINKVAQLTDQIVQAKEDHKNVQVPETSAHKAAKEFIDRNKEWYTSKSADHVAMQAFSQAKADEISLSRPDLTPEEVFLMTEQAVKEKFSDKFEKPKTASPVLAPAPQAPASVAYANLPDAIKKEIQTLQRHSKLFDVKKYIADCKLMGRI